MTALVVIDVQRDFCEGGAIPIDGGAAVARRISACMGSSPYDLVVGVRDWHVDPGVHFASGEPDWVESFPRHCVADTDGASWHPGLFTHADFDELLAQEFRKGARTPAFSGFEGVNAQGTTLGGWLRGWGVQSIDVAGLAFSGCVRATCEDGVAQGFGVRVVRDLCADPLGYGDVSARTEQVLGALGVGVVTHVEMETGAIPVTT